MDTPDKGRLFIVANGPSINEVDLDLLIGEQAWGMNRIHLKYPEIQWRPNRWFWGDHPQEAWQLEELFMHVENYPGEECWVRSDMCEMLLGQYKPHGDDWPFYDELPEHVTNWGFCVKHAARFHSDRAPKEPHWISPTEFCKPTSTAYVAWMSGIWEGYDPIIFLGTDAGFRPAVDGEQQQTHFHPGYYAGHVKTSEKTADRINAMLAWEHDVMQNWAAANGRQILLASPGGTIESHPRVKFEDLFA